MLKTAVFSSGGAHGIYHAGVLLGLEKQNHLATIEHMIGCSAGALTVGLYAIGYTPNEVYKIALNINFATCFAPDPTALASKMCVCEPTKYHQQLEYYFRQRNAMTTTFKDVHEERGLCLYVSGYGIRAGPTLFSTETHPDMTILDALKISSNMTVILPYLEYDGDYWTDGVMSGRLPVDQFPEIHHLFEKPETYVASLIHASASSYEKAQVDAMSTVTRHLLVLERMTTLHTHLDASRVLTCSVAYGTGSSFTLTTPQSILLGKQGRDAVSKLLQTTLIHEPDTDAPVDPDPDPTPQEQESNPTRKRTASDVDD